MFSKRPRNRRTGLSLTTNPSQKMGQHRRFKAFFVFPIFPGFFCFSLFPPSAAHPAPGNFLPQNPFWDLRTSLCRRRKATFRGLESWGRSGGGRHTLWSAHQTTVSRVYGGLQYRHLLKGCALCYVVLPSLFGTQILGCLAPRGFEQQNALLMETSI